MHWARSRRLRSSSSSRRAASSSCCGARATRRWRSRRLSRASWSRRSSSSAPPSCTSTRKRATMRGVYHSGSRELQDRFDTRRLADRIEERIVHDSIDEGDRAFIEARDMFFLATADADGRPQCSYKGGDPGFVRVLDEHVLAFPNYDGNGMFLSMGNVRPTPHAGWFSTAFLSARPSRLPVNATASTDSKDALRGS